MTQMAADLRRCERGRLGCVRVETKPVSAEIQNFGTTGLPRRTDGGCPIKS